MRKSNASSEKMYLSLTYIYYLKLSMFVFPSHKKTHATRLSFYHQVRTSCLESPIPTQRDPRFFLNSEAIST